MISSISSLFAEHRQVDATNDIDGTTWSNHVLKNFLDILSTHTIQVDIAEKSKGKLIMVFHSFITAM